MKKLKRTSIYYKNTEETWKCAAVMTTPAEGS